MVMRSERLRVVEQLARNREEKLARELAALRRAHGEQAARLAELERLQRDYAEGLEGLGREGVDAQRLREHRRFADRLDEAAVRQRALVTEVEARIARQVRALAEASARRQALEKTVARLRAEEARAAVRREQREADDRAAQRRVPID